jgi:hypothetical protein
MGRPVGSKNKSKESVEVVGPVIETKEAVVVNEEKKEEPAKAVQVKPKLEPLGPGQKYFEAPDGTILIGEADMPHLRYRAGNGGKGMFINPKR